MEQPFFYKVQIVAIIVGKSIYILKIADIIRVTVDMLKNCRD
ncbi:hypothetical protein P4T37_01545 [Bacillus mobilis]|nr:hypothetical protein [Bacillus mobilis]MED0935408.1 hypothetical protein [Bacillus mobilis]